MARTYTRHNLTPPMLKRLSQLVNGRPHGHGISLTALIVRGLAEELSGGEYPLTCRATEAGKTALEQARREGW